MAFDTARNSASPPFAHATIASPSPRGRPAPRSSPLQERTMPVPVIPTTRGSGSWLANRPIAVKIGAAVTVLAVVAVAMAVLAVQRIGALNDAAGRINENVVTLADLADIQRSWQGDRSRFNTYPLADPQTRAALLTDLAERRETIEGQLDAYAEVTVNKEAFEVFRGHVDQYYLVAQGQLVAAAAAGRSEEHTSELQSRPYLVCRLLP